MAWEGGAGGHLKQELYEQLYKQSGFLGKLGRDHHVPWRFWGAAFGPRGLELDTCTLMDETV